MNLKQTVYLWRWKIAASAPGRRAGRDRMGRISVFNILVTHHGGADWGMTVGFPPLVERRPALGAAGACALAGFTSGLLHC